MTINLEPLNGYPESLEHYAEICNDCCNQAESILQEMRDPSSIADLARAVIYYAAYLGEFEHTLNQAYRATSRMAKYLNDHPRLLLELKETELEILHYIEGVQQHSLNITDDLRQEIDQLKSNIQAADEGHFDNIVSSTHLKYDPIEWTAKYEAIIDEANAEAYSHLTNIPRGMGFCFGYWHEKQNALLKRGIKWQTPQQMNPGVMFD